MSFHYNFERWEKFTKKEYCPICNAEPMPEGMEDVYELYYTWLNAEPKECIKGACHVTSKIHALELYELNDEELLGFMKEVNIYAKALKKITKCVKINYEIHGNTIPHLHLHLYPRFLDDPFPGKAIDYNKKSMEIYKEGEYDQFIQQLKEEIKKVLKEKKEKSIN